MLKNESITSAVKAGEWRCSRIP